MSVSWSPRRGVLCVVGGWAVLLAGAVDVPAADRMVLGEQFTATWCTYCPGVRQAYSDLMDAYPDRFVCMMIHGSDAYATDWGDDRMTLYGCWGSFPTTVQDGILKRSGSTAGGYAEPDFLDRMVVETDVTLALSGSLVDGSTYEIVAEVGVEADGTERPAVVHIVQVLDHYPDSDATYRNNFMQAAEIETVYLEPGGTYVVERELTFTGDSWESKENIRIVAWVQDVGPFSDESEVFQAAVMPWPFEAPPEIGDCNCDGIIDFFDIDPFVMAMTAPESYETAYPDCDLSTADCNEDGVVDFFDIDPFIALITK